MSDVTNPDAADLRTIARLVAEIDGLGVPSTASEVVDRLRRIHLAGYRVEQRCARLLADVDELKQRLHDVRGEDARKLAASDLAALHLRRGIDNALATYHDDALPCEETCNRMAADLRSAVAAADAVDASVD